MSDVGPEHHRLEGGGTYDLGKCVVDGSVIVHDLWGFVNVVNDEAKLYL